MILPKGPKNFAAALVHVFQFFFEIFSLFGKNCKPVVILVFGLLQDRVLAGPKNCAAALVPDFQFFQKILIFVEKKIPAVIRPGWPPPGSRLGGPKKLRTRPGP